MALYKELDVATIPAHTKQAAEAALKHGCKALGFALAPEIRWCTPVTNQSEVDRVVKMTPRGEWNPPGYRFSLVAFNGLVDSRHYVMWLRAGMSNKEAAITVLHELGHLSHQMSGQPNGDWGSAERAWEEADVEAFAQQQYRRLGKIA